MPEIKVFILHEEGEIDEPWSNFMEDMFTTDLPDGCRDLGLEVTRLWVKNLIGFKTKDLQNAWRLFIFSETMLKTFKNRKSPLHESNILKESSDRNIFLILGSEEDTEFISEVRQTLCILLGFAKHHEVQTTESEKIFNEIMDLISPMSLVLHPNIMSCEDKNQHLTLVGNKPYPTLKEGQHFQVEFVDDESTLEVEANLFNPYTLLFQNPGHAPGIINANVFVSEKENPAERIQLGDSIKVWFQSDLDKVNGILEKNVRPFEFLAQSLNLNSNDEHLNEKIDQVLTESFRKQVPESKLTVVFGSDQGTGNNNEEDNKRRREFSPTLLHFAAMHGLNNLTALLLRCPGAIRAYGTANCDGDFPTNLAEKYGHWDLRDYMQDYMEVSAMVDHEMEGEVMTSRVMSEMVTGLYDVESLYEARTSPSNSSPGYLAMRALPSNEIYDSPFIHPIMLAEEEDKHDDLLKKVLEGTEENIYISLNADQYQQGSEVTYMSLNDIPPVPPRDQESSHASRLPDLPPLPPSHPPPSQAVEKEKLSGADRKSYDSIKIPKMINHVTTAQHELIFLQQKVKSGELTTNQALLRFKEWERKHKEQPASFQYQQESLQRIRDSLNKRREQKRLKGESYQIEITAPIVAGSSTYEKVLRKTNGPNAVNVEEACYGVTKKKNPKKELENLPPVPCPRQSTSSSLDSDLSQGSSNVVYTDKYSTRMFNDGFSKKINQKPSPRNVMVENMYTPRLTTNHYIRDPVTGPPPIPPRDAHR